MSKDLTQDDYIAAAQACGCDVATIRAVDYIESRGSGFDAMGRPKILFERHWFRKLTSGVYDQTHPHLSHRYLSPRENPSYKRDQWAILTEARTLDESAANQSASWGRFQIMGFNYLLAGCRSVRQFVARMEESEAQHLLMFVAFVTRKGLNEALAQHDWATFAHGYNGADYASNNYDKKLKRAYERFAAEGAPESVSAKLRRMVGLA